MTVVKSFFITIVLTGGLLSCTAETAKKEITLDHQFIWKLPGAVRYNGGNAAVDMAGNEWLKTWSTDFPLPLVRDMVTSGEFLLFLGYKEWSQMASGEDGSSNYNLLCYNLRDGTLNFELEIVANVSCRVFPLAGRKEVLVIVDALPQLANLETGALSEVHGTLLQGEVADVAQISDDIVVVSMLEAAQFDPPHTRKVWQYSLNLNEYEVTELSSLHAAYHPVSSLGEASLVYFDGLASISAVNLDLNVLLWQTPLPVDTDSETPQFDNLSSVAIASYGERVYVTVGTAVFILDAENGEQLLSLEDLEEGMLSAILDEKHLFWWTMEGIQVIDYETGEEVAVFERGFLFASHDGVLISVANDGVVKIYNELQGDVTKNLSLRKDFGAFLIDSGGGLVVVEPDNMLTRYK